MAAGKNIKSVMGGENKQIHSQILENMRIVLYNQQYEENENGQTNGASFERRC